jgi:hypothetical protein
MIKNFFKTKNCQIFMQLMSSYIYFIYFIKKRLFFLIFKGGIIPPVKIISNTLELKPEIL